MKNKRNDEILKIHNLFNNILSNFNGNFIQILKDIGYGENGDDIYYIEDKELLELLENFIRKNNITNEKGNKNLFGEYLYIYNLFFEVFWIEYKDKRFGQMLTNIGLYKNGTKYIKELINEEGIIINTNENDIFITNIIYSYINSLIFKANNNINNQSLFKEYMNKIIHFYNSINDINLTKSYHLYEYIYKYSNRTIFEYFIKYK